MLLPCSGILVKECAMRARLSLTWVTICVCLTVAYPVSVGAQDGDPPTVPPPAEDCSGPLTSRSCADDALDFPGALDQPTVPPDCSGPVTPLDCVDPNANPTTAIDRDLDGLDNDTEEWIGTDPDNPDTDGDGLGDYDEYVPGLEYLDCAIRVDCDGDGLNDGEEALRGTDFLNPDTDGDKLGDGVEVQLGKNPLDPTDNQTPEVSGGTEQVLPTPTNAANEIVSTETAFAETCVVMRFFEICVPAETTGAVVR
jgi:hypothetical protein